MLLKGSYEESFLPQYDKDTVLNDIRSTNANSANNAVDDTYPNPKICHIFLEDHLCKILQKGAFEFTGYFEPNNKCDEDNNALTSICFFNAIIWRIGGINHVDHVIGFSNCTIYLNPITADSSRKFITLRDI